MKWQSPRGLAFGVAVMLAVVISIIYAIASLVIYEQISYPLAGIIFIAVLSIAFSLFVSVLEKFINKRIKLLHKTIHRLKRTPGNEARVDMKSDVLQALDEEVEEWAETQRKEIAKLKETEAFRREFVGNVSHELKTPIFNIQGYIDTLLEGGLEDEKINRKYLEKASKSVDRLIAIVEDLDAITGFESGQLDLDIQKINLAEQVREVFESLEAKAKKFGISLQIKGGDDSPIWVMADKRRIRQVLTNLVNNSIKYGNDGGNTLVRFLDMDKSVLVEVADDGIGIMEKHLSRLFERFYRVDDSRSRDRGGTGLGLAIVKHIIDAHGQTINVRSTESVGSTFSFTLQKAN